MTSNQGHKYFKKVDQLLSKYGESREANVNYFSDYMYQISSNLKKSKRILLVTEESLYCLKRESLKIVVRIKLKNLTKMTIIRNSSAVLALSTVNDEDIKSSQPMEFLMETLKRTELIFYIVN